MLKFYTGFEINDQTGNALTEKEMTTLHYDRITSLQVNPVVAHLSCVLCPSALVPVVVFPLKSSGFLLISLSIIVHLEYVCGDYVYVI